MIKNGFSEKGLTLIEVLISLGILTVIILTGFAAVTRFQNQNRNTRQEIIASLLGQAKMEELLNLNYTAQALDPFLDWKPFSGPEKLNPLGLEDPTGKFFRQWQILENAPKKDMKKITVRTVWKDQKGKEKNLEFISSKTREF